MGKEGDHQKEMGGRRGIIKKRWGGGRRGLLKRDGGEEGDY